MPDGATAGPEPATGVGRGVMVSTGTQIVAKVLHLGLNLVTTVALVRALGPDAYGSYVLVLTLTLLAGLVADFGLTQLVIREVAREPQREGELVGTMLAVRGALAVVAVLLPQLVLWGLGEPAVVHLAALVSALVFFGDALLSVALVAFHVRVEQQYEALVRVVMEAVETAVVLVLLAAGAPLPGLFAAPVAGIVAGAAVALPLARRRYRVRLQVRRDLVRRLLIEALPIGPALLIGVLSLKLDTVVLSTMRPDSDVGRYGAAHRPVEYLLLASAVFIGVLFPLVSRAWAGQDAVALRAWYRRGTEALVAVFVLVPLALLAAAGPMLQTVFGPAFTPAAPTMTVLGIALVLMVVNAWQSLVLLAGGFQRITLRYNAIALVLTIVSCVALVAGVGMIGAALAALITAVYVLTASTLAIRRHMALTLDARRLAGVALAAAVGGLALLVARLLHLPWPVVVLAAVVGHLAALVATRWHRAFREVLT
ncbi:oligosaccharide flippase family protein [Nakamurella leprariae]|uniref:Oligosaccharide flippase family protein n=1 Tax=Nakamurella leprariae TaxID=2803911 RepID=A0A939C0E8_9ACTN|nr:oligosaccharide flippase family protein [Nakamurella leprariae]MBM9469150.1 oligosaccharide flippase family protein [Nakamurella leprariae]